MKLSIIVPSLDGRVPPSLTKQVATCPDVEIVSVVGVRPVGKARNEGLKRAKGEYIAWVDSDDEVADNWLSQILLNLNLQPQPSSQPQPDVLVFDAEYVGWKYDRESVWGIDQKEVSAARLVHDLYRDASRPSALWMYVTRRELWEGRSFDETIEVGEDYLLPLVLTKARTCVYLPKRLYRYCCTKGSVINSKTARHDVQTIEVQRRRFETCPREYRDSCLIGHLISTYWMGDALAVGNYPYAGAEECHLAERVRAEMRRNLVRGLLALVKAGGMPLSERLKWGARFVLSALNCWTLQRWHNRKR